MKLKVFLSVIFALTFIFVQVSLARNIPYPNELKGYRFFGKGKLRELKLGFSTKADVKRLFGDNCEVSCDYNKNWTVQFSYFEDFTKEVMVDNKITKYIPSSKSLGKLYSVTLIPKSKISIGKIRLAPKFRRGGGGSSAHDGEGSGENVSFHTYSDKYGLKYTIFDSVTYTTNKNSSKWRKGDLISIQYELPEKMEEKMLVKER